MRDSSAEMLKFAFPSVSCEPVVREVTPALIADVKVIGRWSQEELCLLDYRIVNPDAPS